MHYDIISPYQIYSDSDLDAAIYWLARMVEGVKILSLLLEDWLYQPLKI